jgi:hypothetical protein
MLTFVDFSERWRNRPCIILYAEDSYFSPNSRLIFDGLKRAFQGKEAIA